MQSRFAIMLSFISLGVIAQESNKPASGSLAEFNAALAAVMKAPVVISIKGRKTESFCKRPDVLNDTELKKMQLACEKTWSDPVASDYQKAAARYILGKTKTQYTGRDLAARYCDEALPLLAVVADFYDQKSISGNGPHEAMAGCLIATERYELAQSWVERGLGRRETSQMHYLGGMAWQGLKAWAPAKAAFEKSIALDPNNDAAKKMLAQAESLLNPGGSSDTEPPPPEPMVANNSEECQSWRAAITANRFVCDPLMDESFDEFFSCMDEGMTASGYASRAEEQTQTLYQTCGLSSWIDESLKP